MSPKIDRLVVEKGRTIQRGEVWEKRMYRLEVDVSDVTTEEALNKARLDLGSKIDGWLGSDLEAAGEIAAFDPKNEVPNIDLAELGACPWISYRNKEPAKPGQPAWIKNPVHFTSFEAPNVLKELVKALNRLPDKRLVLGDMEYTFSGKDRDTEKPKPLFVSRKPVKPNGAR